MNERCLIINGGGTKNIVPVERIAFVSLKENENGYDATFYIDSGASITLGGLSDDDKDRIINIMQFKNQEK